jgi:hypothetical protein
MITSTAWDMPSQWFKAKENLVIISQQADIRQSQQAAQEGLHSITRLP